MIESSPKKSSATHDFRLMMRRRWRQLALVGILALVALAISVFCAVAWLKPSPSVDRVINMTTDVSPMRKLVSERLRDEASKRHLEIRLTEQSYGALDSLEAVDTPNEFKLAMVPGGITARDYPNVRLVTELTREPLHVMVRPGLAEKGLAGLRGSRINLGIRSSASFHLSLEVLDFVGLQPRGDDGTGNFIAEEDPQDQIYARLGRLEGLRGPDREAAIGQLSDAYFFLAPMPSLLARRLASKAGYQVVAVPFVQAFCMDRLSPARASGIRIDRTMLSAGVIPAYACSGEPPAPAKDCPTIFAPLLLVAQDDADPEAVVRILESVFESPLTSTFRPPALREQQHPFPPHAGMLKYLRRNDPFFTPEMQSNFEKGFGLAGAFVSGLITLYTFLRVNKLNRFESYYQEIGQIERVARGIEVDPAAPAEIAGLQSYLEERLSTLKCKVMEDFAAGGMEGEGLVTGIIAMINDTRASLARPAMTREAVIDTPVPAELPISGSE